MENAIRKLNESGNYRVLKRLELPSSFSEPDDMPKRIALIVDTETTGLDPNSDKIIEIGMVAVEYSPISSKFYRVVASYSGFEDPGVQLPEEIIEITGITDAMVAGKEFDRDEIDHLVSKASIVIAHQAAFDRKFLEKRFPKFEKIAWGCSMSQIDWRAQGLTSRSLDYLLYKCSNTFIDAHRALNDTQGLAVLLSSNLPSGKCTAFEELLGKARVATVRTWAIGAPFEAKDTLKSRGYFWSDGTHNRPKSWYKDLDEDEVNGELQFLSEIFPHNDTRTVVLHRIDAYARFSIRE